MSMDLNFEAEPLQNEDAFGEAEEEANVRDHRTRGGGVPAPAPRPAGLPIRPFVARPVVVGRPLVLRGPAFAGGRLFGGAPRFRVGFSPRRSFGSGFIPRPGFGFRRPGFGFGPGSRRRFGFFRRPPFGPGFGFGGDGLAQPPVGGGSPVSELVSWAQGCLSQIGSEPIPQNGILGPATRRALAAFQTENQLAATGVLDSQTIAALQAACAPGDQGTGGGGGE